MAKKKIIKIIKLQIQSGKATPAPPIGPALGSAQVNIMAFCKDFNAQTQGSTDILPVVISVYADKTFSFILKQPPMSRLILGKAKIAKGSSINRDKVGSISKQDVKEIIQRKAPDLRLKHPINTEEGFAAAFNIVAGTARSMGINVEQN
jgi:large subunit ribosomal protein L11